MSQSQDRWVLGATILSESAWLFAVFGVLGATLGLDGSPMRWPSLLVIMGVATLLARLRPSFIAAFAVLSVGAIAAGSVDGLIRWPSLLTAVVIASMLAYHRPIKAASAEVMYLLRFVAGVSVVYFMVASNVTRGVGGFDLSWASIAFFDSAPEGYRLVALIGILMGMALWWRGGSLAGKEFPIESLTFSFRLGVFGLAIATALDILHPADLDTFPMIFIFFAAGLGGLSVGHLLPETKESAKARTWPKVIGVVVTSVLGAGLVFSFLQRDILGYLSRPALSMLDSVVNGVFWGLVIPISAAWTVFVNAVLSIFDTAFGGMRDSAGNVHTVPFSDVSTVLNYTKDYSYAVLDVGVAYRESVDEVMAELEVIGAEMMEDSELARDILEPLEVQGLNSLDDSAVVIRARIKTRPGRQWAMRRAFNRRMKNRFDDLGIEIPFPQTTVHLAGGDGPQPPTGD